MPCNNLQNQNQNQNLPFSLPARCLSLSHYSHLLLNIFPTMHVNHVPSPGVHLPPCVSTFLLSSFTLSYASSRIGVYGVSGDHRQRRSQRPQPCLSLLSLSLSVSPSPWLLLERKTEEGETLYLYFYFHILNFFIML